MDNGFYVVKDDQGIYGYFLDEENANRCAEYFETQVYGELDEPGVAHIFVWRYDFDDFHWAE